MAVLQGHKKGVTWMTKFSFSLIYLALNSENYTVLNFEKVNLIMIFQNGLLDVPKPTEMTTLFGKDSFLIVYSVNINSLLLCTEVAVSYHNR